MASNERWLASFSWYFILLVRGRCRGAAAGGGCLCLANFAFCHVQDAFTLCLASLAAESGELCDFPPTHSLSSSWLLLFAPVIVTESSTAVVICVKNAACALLFVDADRRVDRVSTLR